MHFGIKPLFCTNLTQNKRNKTRNGKEFICRTVSPALGKDMMDGLNRLAKAQERKQFPFWLWLASVFFLSTGPVMLFLALFGGGPIRPDLVTASSVFTAIFAGLALYTVRRFWKAKNNPEIPILAQSIEGTCRRIRKDLQIPANAVSIDVIQFCYKVKKGRIALCFSMRSPMYDNIEFQAFLDSSTLYLSDMEHVYAIPLASLHAITSIDKKIVISGWHKKSPPMAYGATVAQYGLVGISGYHILEIREHGATWGIYVPSYELHTLKKLTGLSAENTLRL